MAELIITHITQQELDSGVLPMNTVLCEMFYQSEGMKSKSGIIIGVLTDRTYASPENPQDDSSHIADFSENAMLVKKVPQKLYFDPNDEKSMSWETDMELEVGDMVWSDTIESKNAITLECEGKYYKLIPYEFLYVAKRGKEVIPLNGYVLLSEVHPLKLSELDVTNCDRIDKTKGLVKYVGSCNKRYRNPDFVDFQGLKEGDTVLFDKKAVPFFLERTSFNNFFSETGERFLVCQRRRINMILERK